MAGCCFASPIRDAFSPYIPFIDNLCNMLGVVFEERRQRRLNDSIMAELESRVVERTRDLELEIRGARTGGSGITAQRGESSNHPELNW